MGKLWVMVEGGRDFSIQVHPEVGGETMYEQCVAVFEERLPYLSVDEGDLEDIWTMIPRDQILAVRYQSDENMAKAAAAVAAQVNPES